jgi:hypothetical protein
MAATRARTKRRQLEEFACVHPNAAGLDIGSETIVAAVPPDRDDQAVRAFATFTPDLHALVAWLLACGITTVAMESTGVYWIAICAPRSASVECFHSETSQGVCEWLAGQAGRTEATPCLKHPRQSGGQILDDLSRC